MATIINNPNGVEGGDGTGSGFLAGIVIAAVLVVLFIVFGLPALRRNNAAPAPSQGSVDVNLKLPTTNNNNPPPATNPGTPNTY